MGSRIARSLLGLIATFVFAASAHATPVGSFTYEAVTGGNRSHIDGSAIYFNPTGTGSFRITVSAFEASGIQQVTFPAAAAGWTGGGFVDSAAPYETTYGWSAGATASPGLSAMIRANNSTQASLAYAFVADSTPPTDAFLLATDARSEQCDCGVELELSPGTDAGSGIRAWYAKKSEAEIDEAGECGTFGPANYGIAQPASGFIDTAATSGHCYRYAIYVLDNVNNTIETLDHQVELPERVPAAASFDGFTPLTGSAWMHAAEDTLYFNPEQAGSFRLNASAAHPSGITSVRFAAPGVSDWTPSTTTVDSSDPFAAEWSWSAGAAAPGARTLTALATDGEEGQANFSVTADSTPPSGGAVTYADGVASGPVAVTFTRGSDAGAGIASHLLLRRDASLTSQTCGTFGAWTPVGSTDPVSPVSVAELTAGSCVQFALRVTDRVGNAALVTGASTVRVEAAIATTPTAQTPTTQTPTAQTPVTSTPPTPSFVTGSSRSETVVGGAAPDTIVAGGGNDRVTAGAGNDELDGGSGNDVLSAGAGNDIVGAGSGNDRADGGSGSDQITAGAGNDIAAGGAGRDLLVGGSGKDTLKGGAGNDVLLAQDGRGGDVVQCGGGTDTVSADKGDFVARDCERFTETSPAQQPTGVTTPPKSTGKPTKVSICHATGNADRPYEWLTVAIDGLNGHTRHADDIVPAPEMGCPKSTRPAPVAEPAGSAPPPPPVVTAPVEPVSPTPPPATTPAPVVTPPVAQPTPPKPASPVVDTCPENAPVSMTTNQPSTILLAACGSRAQIEITSDPWVHVLLPMATPRLVTTHAVGYGLATFKLSSGATVSWTTLASVHSLHQVTISKGAHVTSMFAMGAARWGYAPSFTSVHTELTRRDLVELAQKVSRCQGVVMSPIVCR